MKRRTKEKIGKWGGAAVGIGIGVGITLVTISTCGVVPGLGALGITSGLKAIGGGAMIRGIIVAAAGNGATAATGSYAGEKIASKIGNKKKKKKK